MDEWVDVALAVGPSLVAIVTVVASWSQNRQRMSIDGKRLDTEQRNRSEDERRDERERRRVAYERCAATAHTYISRESASAYTDLVAAWTSALAVASPTVRPVLEKLLLNVPGNEGPDRVTELLRDLGNALSLESDETDRSSAAAN